MVIRAPVPVSPPERRETLRLPDGRALAWSEWGPPDGSPVLFCTGAALSGRLGFGEADLPGPRSAPPRPRSSGPGAVRPRPCADAGLPDVAGMVAAVREDAAAFERHFARMATAEGLTG